MSTPVLIRRSAIDSNGRVYLEKDIRERMKLGNGEEVEVRYIESGNAKMIQITKVQKEK